MARSAKRSRKAQPRRTYCPACDAPLTPELAQVQAPTCPQCGEILLPVRAAGFWRRAAASAVDFGVLIVTAGLLNWVLLALMDMPPLTEDASGIDALLRLLEVSPVALLWRTTPFWVMTALYLGLFWGLTGASVGGRLLKIRVVDDRGERPEPLRVALRVLANFAGLIPGALGWLWTAFDLEKRAWHDHLARTYVVRDR